jgi:high frequency lysogenization protein
MKHSDEDRTLALAGIFHAAALVQELAKQGHTSTDGMQASIRSLFLIDVDDVPAVFGGVSGVRRGLEVLSGYIGQNKRPESMEILSYVFTLMHLTKKFLRNRSMVDHVAETLQGLQRQKDYFDSLNQQDTYLNPTVIARLAELYSETISTLQPRVMVKGEPAWLQQEAVVEKIRSLLLAGLRAAVLWYQVGGGRFQFLLRRKHYAAMADSILKRV